jgi:hypothetical protein
MMTSDSTLFQTKKNQLESWFISAFQQMWWARQESNLLPEGIGLRSHYLSARPIPLHSIEKNIA